MKISEQLLTNEHFIIGKNDDPKGKRFLLSDLNPMEIGEIIRQIVSQNLNLWVSRYNEIEPNLIIFTVKDDMNFNCEDVEIEFQTREFSRRRHHEAKMDSKV